MNYLPDLPTKKPGFCPLSGRQLLEIKEQFPIGHVLAGLPTKFGKPFPHAARVSFVKMSGKITDILMNLETAYDLRVFSSADMPVLHRICVQTFLDEERIYTFRSNRVRPPGEAAKIAAAIREYADDPILGVLYVRRLNPQG